MTLRTIKLSCLALAFAATLDRASAADGDTLPSGWQDRVGADVTAGEYAFSLAAGDRWSAPNRAQDLRVTTSAGVIELGPRTRPDSWQVKLSVVRFGRGSALHELSAGRWVAQGNRIELERGAITEWYVNDARGLEQGFTIHQRPAGMAGEALVLEMRLDTELRTRLSPATQSVSFLAGDGSEVLRYAKLIVQDAAGQVLDAHFGLEGDRLRIVLSDAGARYPIVVDPLTDSPSWTAEGDQSGAFLGFSVATAGDVNGDGYSDVIVGAPDYDGGQINEGRAFVYLGSAQGLQSSPAWIAEPNTTSAEFGRSVCTAGDVNGDGFDDVVVGAPYSSVAVAYGGVAYLYLGSATGLSNAPNWSAVTDQPYANFGYCVSTAGDVNGDGYADVVVGSPRASWGVANEGIAYLYAGGPSGLSGNPLWLGGSGQTNSYWGASVASAGDVNADGYGDVIIGAPSWGNGHSGEGTAVLCPGHPGGLGSPLWRGEGGQTNAGYGTSVANAGDVNGDGYGDILVGAPGYTVAVTREGAAFLYAGSSSGLSSSPVWTTRSFQTDALWGASVATAGDINSDGYADFMVGSPRYTGSHLQEGAVSAYLGGVAWPTAVQDWFHLGAQDYAQYGGSVATAGDVNGDGFSEVIVGAILYDSGQTDEGKAFVYSGSTSRPESIGERFAHPTLASYYGTSLAAGNLNYDSSFHFDGFQGHFDGGDVFAVGAPGDPGLGEKGYVEYYYGYYEYFFERGFQSRRIEAVEASTLFGQAVAFAEMGASWPRLIIGEPGHSNGQVGEGRLHFRDIDGGGPLAFAYESNVAGDGLGASVANAGDVNGDGLQDVIAGAPGNDRALLFLGALAYDSVVPMWESSGGHTFGASVAGAGDVNGDGFCDVVVGAPFDLYLGSATLFLGSPSGPATTPAWKVFGAENDAELGISVAAAGDVNGDGFSDVVVGAPYSWLSQIRGGAAFLYAGSGSGLSTSAAWAVGGDQDSYFGAAVGTGGDVNADGYSDILVGSPRYDVQQWDEGAVFLYAGSPSWPQASPMWSKLGAEINDGLGSALAVADMNWDGLGDIIAGAPSFLQPGATWLFGANDLPVGQFNSPTQYIDQDPALYGVAGAFYLQQMGRTPAGRGKVGIEWEIQPFGTPLDGSHRQRSGYRDTGIPDGVFPYGSWEHLDTLVSGLAADTRYHWRARTFRNSPFFPHSRWFSMVANGVAEADLRTEAGCRVQFVPFGQGLAGKGGFVPKLTGTNGSCATDGHSIHITEGLGGASGVLFISFQNQDLFPFYGGHLYIGFSAPWRTFPIKLLGPVGVAGAGYLDIPGQSVTPLAGYAVYLQTVVTDAAATKGYSITNGLRMDVIR